MARLDGATMSDAQSTVYARSRVATILSLVQSIERFPGLPMDVTEFASSAVHQLKLLDLHLNSLVDPSQFNKRKSDRNYQPATLPHAQTVTLDPIIPSDESGNITFERADRVDPAPPIGGRK